MKAVKRQVDGIVGIEIFLEVCGGPRLSQARLEETIHARRVRPTKAREPRYR